MVLRRGSRVVSITEPWEVLVVRSLYPAYLNGRPRPSPLDSFWCVRARDNRGVWMYRSQLRRP